MPLIRGTLLVKNREPESHLVSILYFLPSQVEGVVARSTLLKEVSRRNMYKRGCIRRLTGENHNEGTRYILVNEPQRETTTVFYHPGNAIILYIISH